MTEPPVARRALALFCLALIAAVAACSSTASRPSAQISAAPPTDTGSAPAPVSPAADSQAPAPAAVILARSHVPVLCYHQVRDWTGRDSRGDRALTTPVAVFAEQMDALAAAGYHPVTSDQLYRHLADGAALPPKPIMISFDDGSMGQWPNAFRILRAHRFTATFFIMTVTINKPGGWLSADQIRALDRAGMTIGIHTWDHHAVTGYTPADWKVQLTDAQATLEKIVGHPVTSFAYPYGSWNNPALAHLAADDVRIAFQLADRPSPTTPLLTVRRIMPPPSASIPAFLHRLATAS